MSYIGAESKVSDCDTPFLARLYRKQRLAKVSV
jgi:hypothetical protein